VVLHPGDVLAAMGTPTTLERLEDLFDTAAERSGQPDREPRGSGQ
jgi:hypothetical protein